MDILYDKLSEYIGVGGKYQKHVNMFGHDADEDTDYILVNGLYVLAIPKEAITLHPEIPEYEIMDWIESVADESTQELEYAGVIEKNINGHNKPVRVFKNEVGESIQVQDIFFREFLYRPFTPQNDFVAELSFTGNNPNDPVCMWKSGILLGIFMPYLL